ncbi:MAG TPA: XdhC family protein [Anaerolineaceae bacterium]|jgi:xanthine dehydrogenase accessory factor|nr:XdhC family protein [Anaerolineaceae bacterium]HNW14346.1 XdhC family protein [Anaerolineaceae bacterium]HOE01776.1 XdhC family protein [Anaerolineaceae bacterium]
MREIWQVVQQWQAEKQQVALATVVQVTGSSLRPEGSKLVISSGGAIHGSVTGGCVEGAVFEEAREVLKDRAPRLLSYGVTNQQAWDVGLSCGGSVEILVEAMDTPDWQAVLPPLARVLAENQLAALLTIIRGDDVGKKMLVLPDGQTHGSLGNKELDQEAIGNLPENWATRLPLQITLKNGEELFADFIVPPPRLVIIGASHIAIPLVALANTLQFHTIVVDARSAFATRERFPHAHELIVGWPADVLQQLKLDAATCVVALSHDDKLDNPALLFAITSPARYIGALGSRTTNAKRLEDLRAEGAKEQDLKRIHAPVGLKIGARQPEEIALSIMAEIVATAHGHDG